MTTPLPTAPPRRKKHLDKKDISEPYDFVHVSHVGLDFNSEDVKRAIRPTSSEFRSPTQPGNFYEPVVRSNETPILSATPPQNEFTPPVEQAPKYGKPSTAAPSREPDVVEYVNRPSAHLYMNINNEARPSRKKNPPPPPPQAQKPPLIEEPIVVAFRAQPEPSPDAPLAEAPSIGTAQRIEVAPPSVILDRPGMLGEMRLGLGLDDPIPLTAGISSKYRTPTMITPREMAVDVPTPMRTEGKEEPPPLYVAPKAPLVKGTAVDVPTPPKPQDKPKVALDPPVERRMAPSPPGEPEAPPPAAKPAAPFVPPSAARSSPHLKNVISELKVKQTGSEEQKDENPVEENNNDSKKALLEKEETHEYISLTAVRTSGASVDSQKSSGSETSTKVEKALTPSETKVAKETEFKVILKETKELKGTKVVADAKPSSVEVPTEASKQEVVSEAKPKEANAEKASLPKKTVGFEESKASEAPEAKATEVSKKPVEEVKQPEAPVAVPKVQPQKVPTPVPRTRITVPKEPATQVKAEEVQQDDGIDTGCSDEDEVIRL